MMAFRRTDQENAPWEYIKIINIVRGQSILVKGKFYEDQKLLTWESEEDYNDY